jgi:RNA polymerase sigma-70 factor (ECF subfamily)
MTTDRWGGEEFDALYRESFPAIARSVFWIVGDIEVAREVAQEAFVAALVHWRKVARYDKPGAWVRRVAIRDAVRVAKRAGTKPSFAASDHVVEPDEMIDVRAAVASLPAAQRAAVILYYLHDLPVAEVAKTLGCSQGTAKTHLSRARHTLAARLGEEYDWWDSTIDCATPCAVVLETKRNLPRPRSYANGRSAPHDDVWCDAPNSARR